MSASSHCHHPQMDIQALPEMIGGVVVLTLRMKCECCGARSRFQGLPVGRSLTEATMSPDGFTVALPTIQIEPKRMTA